MESMRWGAQLAVELLNTVDNARIDNHTIVYDALFTDDSFSGAVVAFAEFSSPPAPFFGVVSGTDSSASEAIANLGLTFALPVVSSFASAPYLSDTVQFSFFWRTIASDEREGYSWCRLIKQHFGWNKIGVVGTSSLYGSGVSNSFSSYCRGFGLDVVFDGRVSPREPVEKFATLVKDVLASGARVIYIGMASIDAAPVLRTMDQLGMLDNPRFVLIGSSDMMTGADNFAVFPGNRSFDAALGAGMRGFLGLAVSPGDSPEVALLRNLSEARGQPFTPYTPFAYDAVLALSLAARDYYRGERLSNLTSGCSFPLYALPQITSSALNISTFMAGWLHCNPGFRGSTGFLRPERAQGDLRQPTNDRAATSYALMNVQYVPGAPGGVRNLQVGTLSENGTLALLAPDAVVYPGGSRQVPVFGRGGGGGGGGGKARDNGVYGTLGLVGVLLLALLLCICCGVALLAICLLLLLCGGGAVLAALLAALTAAAGGSGALALRARRARASDDLAAFQNYSGESPGDGVSREFRELAFGDLVLDKAVGRGCFGTVYRARWREATLVAVKELPLRSEDQRAALIGECNVMAHLGNHPNVVHFIGAVTTLEDRVFIVTEFAAFGSLADVLRSRRVEATELRRLKWAAQAASGVAHIHAEEVVHGDIAARNFLVSKDLTLMVSDFGLASSPADSNGGAKATVGPARWMAPEALRGEPPSKAADAWMFGCFLFELETGGRIPFDHLADGEVTADALVAGLRPKIPPFTSALLADVMRECWQLDAGRRPKVKDLERRFARVLDQAEGGNLHRFGFSSGSKKPPTSNLIHDDDDDGNDKHSTEDLSTDDDDEPKNLPETTFYQQI